MANRINITWDVGTTEAGFAQSSQSGSSYSQLSGLIRTYKPLKITAIKADIYADETYTMTISASHHTVSVEGGANPPTVLYTVEASKVISTAPDEFTFTPASPIFLLPGSYYIIIKPTSSVRFHYHSGSPSYCELFSTADLLFADTINTTLVLPIRLVAYQGTFGEETYTYPRGPKVQMI